MAPVRDPGAYPQVADRIGDAREDDLGLACMRRSGMLIRTKIGVLGFSAGGHLVAAVSTHFTQRLYRGRCGRQRKLPSGFRGGALSGTHAGELRERFRVESVCSGHESDAAYILVQAEDDPIDTVKNSLVYYAALKKAGVPVEMHLYAHGGHGFGLRRTNSPITGWPELVETWLETIGMMPEVRNGGTGR